MRNDVKEVQDEINHLIETDPVLKRLKDSKNQQIMKRTTVIAKRVWARWRKDQRTKFKRAAAAMGAPVQPHELDRTTRF